MGLDEPIGKVATSVMPKRVADIARFSFLDEAGFPSRTTNITGVRAEVEGNSLEAKSSDAYWLISLDRANRGSYDPGADPDYLCQIPLGELQGLLRGLTGCNPKPTKIRVVRIPGENPGSDRGNSHEYQVAVTEAMCRCWNMEYLLNTLR